MAGIILHQSKAEEISLVVCTTGVREEQLQRCIGTHYQSCQIAGLSLSVEVLVDESPSKNLAHLVEVRNRAMSKCKTRWCLLCDDDDYVFHNHVPALMAARHRHELATVILPQAQDANGKRLGFTLSCSLINVDRFTMVGWLCPPEGGEDFFTLSTLQARGHLTIKEPTVTWQVCNEVPSLTRDERIELKYERTGQ